MVALETGTGKGVSCVQPRGRQFGEGVAMGRSQRGYSRWHGEPDWVVAAESVLQIVSAVDCRFRPCGNVESPLRRSEDFICGMCDFFQGCLTRRTWRFGRRFRTRTDGHTCLSVLFRRTSACKNFFIIFFHCG